MCIQRKVVINVEKRELSTKQIRQQWWLSKWCSSNNITRTTGNALMHTFTQTYLGIKQDVQIDYNSMKKRKSKSSLISTKNKTTASRPPDEIL